MEQVTTHSRILYIILLYHKTLFKQLKKSQNFSIFLKKIKKMKSHVTKSSLLKNFGS